MKIIDWLANRVIDFDIRKVLLAARPPCPRHPLTDETLADSIASDAVLFRHGGAI